MFFKFIFNCVCIILFTLISTTSCDSNKNITSNDVIENKGIDLNESSMIEEGFVKAVVKDFSKEQKCSFLFVLEKDNQILQPMIKLSNDFSRDNLKIWLKYRPIKPINPNCNKGIPIDIEKIKIRNN